MLYEVITAVAGIGAALDRFVGSEVFAAMRPADRLELARAHPTECSHRPTMFWTMMSITDVETTTPRRTLNPRSTRVV